MQAAAAAAGAIRFDNASRTAENVSSIPVGGVPRAIREAAESTGLELLPLLYNDALQHATENNFKLAWERLQMLLCMAPDDGEARLLLARVYAAGQRWRDALAALDDATKCGHRVPADLRDMVEKQVSMLHADSDETRSSVAARERGEIKALRAEARRLRSEAATMGATVYQLERETKKWAWTTAGVSTLAIGFILANLLFGGASQPTSRVLVEKDAAEPSAAAMALAGNDAADGTVTEATRPSAPVATDDVSLAGFAAMSLANAAELEGTQLEVVVDNGKAQLVGQVLSSRQRLKAKQIVAAINGVSEVGTDRVEILARTRGTTHTVASGETLSHIAMRYYGSVALAKHIQRANPKNRTLHIGDVIKIPPVD